jgi:hypothetical protein
MADAAKETRAWEMLCARLGRDPHTSEESDTCTLRAAWRAMLAFSDQEAASPTLLEALESLLADCGDAGSDGYVENSIHIDEVRAARAAITLATGKGA